MPLPIVLNDGSTDVTFAISRQNGEVATFISRDDDLAAASKELTVSNRGTPRTGNKARLKMAVPIIRTVAGVTTIVGTSYLEVNTSIPAVASRADRVKLHGLASTLLTSWVSGHVIDDLNAIT